MLLTNENNMKKKLGITEHAISYFRWITTQHNNKINDTNDITTTTSTSSSEHNHIKQSYYHDILSNDHLIAFEKMSKEIFQIVIEAEKKRVSTDGNLYISLSENQILARPKWNNVVASCIFQRTCYYLFKKLDSSMYSSKYKSPKSWYDGLIFHKYAVQTSSNEHTSFGTEVQLIKDQSILKSNTKSKINKSIDNNIEISTNTTTTTTDNQQVTSSITSTTTTPLAKKKTTELKTLKTTITSSSLSTSITQTTSTTTSTNTSTTAIVANKSISDVLPIDAFRDEIINRIARDRVTIIHGETGCGKSSCLPR